MIKWKRCKKEINLAEFMEKHGFSNEKKKGERADRMVKGDDVLIVDIIDTQLRGLEYMYFNPKNTPDRGDIIDFIKNHLQISEIKGINDELRPYVLEDVNVNIEKTIQVENQKREQIGNRNPSNTNWNEKLKPLSNTSYLEVRGISKDTIKNDLFDKRIHQTGKDNNIAFPLFHEQDIKGIAQRNFITDSFEGKLNMTGSNHQQTIWYSRFDPHQTVNRMVIGESPLDLISKYELNKEQYQKENVLFVAVNGEFGEKKIDYLSKVVDFCDPHKMELSFDNDKAGCRFDIKIAGQLISEKLGIQDHVIVEPLKNTNEGILQVTVKYNDQMEGILKTNNIKKEFDKRFPEGNCVVKDLQNNSSKIEATFPDVNNVKQWKKAYDFTTNVRGIKDAYQKKGANRTFETDKSKGKDFNQDLMEKKGLSKEKLFHPTKGQFALKEYKLQQVLKMIDKDPLNHNLKQDRNQLKLELKDLYKNKEQYYKGKEGGKESIESFQKRLTKLGVEIPKIKKSKGFKI